MQRTFTIKKAYGLFALLGVCGIALSAGVVLQTQKQATFGPLWIILPALALLAEFLPVEVSRHGLRITFTLPYVVGMALVAGPLGAIATEVLATSIVSTLQSRRRHIELPFLGINVSIAAIASSLAALAMVLSASFSDRVELHALAFTLAYATANFGMVAYVEWATSARSLGDNVASALEIGVKSFLFYALLVTAVALLVSKNMSTLVPLTLVPVWAIRTGLKQKAAYFEHYYETMTALTLMLQRAHPYTHGHLERVSHTAEEVARKLGLSSSRARLVREAAVLHDVGKIAVDEAILDKPAKLTTAEFDHVKKHAEWGAEILSPVKQFAPIVPWILHHHERPDGRGYPGGLKHEEIPIESRIIAVVDAFDAMTDTQDGKPGRPYRDPMTIDDALEELDRCAGTQFDCAVVQAFREVVAGE